MNARAWLLVIAAIATPVQGMSQAANPNPTGEADVIEIPADVAMVLLHIVAQNNEYALRLVDADNNIVEKLSLSDRGSARVCVRAQTKPRKLKVVGVSLRNGRVLAAIVNRELDNHVYDVSLWDQSTPHTVRVVATAKLDLSGAAAANCGKL
jgi:hypothetical protein